MPMRHRDSGRALGLVIRALEENRLTQDDEDGVVKIISQSIPRVQRLPQSAKHGMARRILQKAVEISNSKQPDADIGVDLMDVTDGDAETNETVETSDKLGTNSESTQVTADAVPDNGRKEALDQTEEDSMTNPTTPGPTSLNDMLPYVKTRSSERDKENGKTTPQPTEKKRRRPSTFSRPDGRRSALTERPRTRYGDVGGINSVVEEVRELIELPLLHVKLYTHLGVDPPRGVLLHGPPGCGKTLLASAIAGELGVAYLKISAPEIVSGMSGDSERK
uniref:ATPase AAA-type core domain-containing protein n=4 Tax=Rhodosorus marinus TaxID=101924 RepID=A0A7S3E9H5_9RHOD|mmetsp:Transcript_18686/g.75101  ORF Transcript_18686/g.75101 Transcript_18686/m.75101 type:complete len:278 (+) Transcript_18686:165-998(+)